MSLVTDITLAIFQLKLGSAFTLKHLSSNDLLQLYIEIYWFFILHHWPMFWGQVLTDIRKFLFHFVTCTPMKYYFFKNSKLLVTIKLKVAAVVAI